MKWADVQKELQKLLNRAVQKNTTIKGCIAAVATGDRNFDWKGSSGMANAAKQIPLTVETPFFLASITKMFTAAVVMRLHEQDNSNWTTQSKSICQMR